MKKIRKGFTLVELSIATAFLAVLLLMIATITISTAAIFQKGVSMRNINATGRNLVDDFTRAITSSPLKNMRDSAGNIEMKTIFQTRNYDGSMFAERVGKDAERIPNPQLSGVFCSGKYSYVWNTGYALYPKKYGVKTADRLTITFTYNTTTGERKAPNDFYLLKFPDPNREACSQDITSGNIQINSSALADPYPEELLSKNDNQMQLALYELTMFPVVQDAASWRSFYTGTFILATLSGDVNIKSTGDHCDPDNSRSISGDFSYCAVNKFNFSAQASGSAE